MSSCPWSTADAAALERDLAPFVTLADAPMAMTAHVVYPAWDAGQCASLSATVIGEIIRGRIGFDGLLMSDDLGMHALSGGFGDRARGVLAAGCDIALHCSGDMAEMRAVAGAVGEIGRCRAARLDRAMATRRGKRSRPRPSPISWRSAMRCWPMADAIELFPAPTCGQLTLDLDGWAGPLDLLLTLARAQKVDLREISILALTDQYLAFIDNARDLRLEIAADYLVMAAWLAYLKSSLLLPRDPSGRSEPRGTGAAPYAPPPAARCDARGGRAADGRATGSAATSSRAARPKGCGSSGGPPGRPACSI